MRKRLVIGAIAVVVIGVALKLLLEWEPKEGTVAWHQREYFADRFPVTWKDRAENKWEQFSGQPQSQNLALLQASAGWKSYQHICALEELGYLRQRRLKLRYSPYPNAPHVRLWDKAKQSLPKRRIWWIQPAGTTMESAVDGYCDVWYEPRDARRWESLIAEVNADILAESNSEKK